MVIFASVFPGCLVTETRSPCFPRWAASAPRWRWISMGMGTRTSSSARRTGLSPAKTRKPRHFERIEGRRNNVLDGRATPTRPLKYITNYLLSKAVQKHCIRHFLLRPSMGLGCGARPSSASATPTPGRSRARAPASGSRPCRACAARRCAPRPQPAIDRKAQLKTGETVCTAPVG